MIKCPSCDGVGQQTVHVHYANRPHAFERQDCRTCKGAGCITEQEQENRRQGDRIAEARRECGLTQKEFSILSKVDYVKQSQIEDDVSRGTAEELKMIRWALKEAGRLRIIELKKRIEKIEELVF